jgi:hypothetical protein
MIRPEDLEAAVAEGIVTDAQAGALRDFAERRQKQRAAARGDEEPFRFARGFSDVFLAVGIVLLSAGLMFFVPPSSIAANLIAAIVIWALAELLVGRRRLVLPGILLALLFVFFAFRAVPAYLLPFVTSSGQPDRYLADVLGSGVPSELALKAGIAAAAAALFYVRFRFPFALLLVAGSLVIGIETLTVMFTAEHDFLRSAVRLGSALGVFAAAMGFDLSDRERVTRRAECAFWLHLLAAPLIVRSLISMVTPSLSMMNNQVAMVILGIVLVLTFAAILIDRRALLVSTLIYLGSVIAYAIPSTTDRRVTFFSTLLVLGALVLALGIGWLPLRRRLLALLPQGLANKLPILVPAV